MKGEIRYGLIEGGGDKDPDPEEAGRVRVRDLGRHGKDVKTEHLPFSQMLSPSTERGFSRPPQEGTVVAYFVPRGAEQTGYVHVLGVPQGKAESSPSIPGNEALPFIETAKAIEAAIKIPPNLKNVFESNRTGIEQLKKEVEEKGEKFKQKLLDGIVTSGAEFDLSGLRNTPLQSIATALESGTNILSSSKLAGLASTAMNFGSIAGSLDLSGLDKSLQGTVNSFFSMLQSDDSSTQPPSGAMWGNQVDMTSVINKVQGDLQGITNRKDLMSVLKGVTKSSYITDCSGDDKISIEVTTPFGNVTQEIGCDGTVTNSGMEIIEQLIQALQSLLGSVLSGGNGRKLFTEEGTPIKEIVDRMTDEGKARELTEFLQNLTDQNESKRRGRTEGNNSGQGAVLRDLFNGSFTTRNGFSLGFNAK